MALRKIIWEVDDLIIWLVGFLTPPEKLPFFSSPCKGDRFAPIKNFEFRIKIFFDKREQSQTRLNYAERSKNLAKQNLSTNQLIN